MENYPLGLIYLSFCSWWMIGWCFSHLLHLLTFCICMKLPIKCGSENERSIWRVYILNQVIVLFFWNLNLLDGSFWLPPLMIGVQVCLLCLCFCLYHCICVISMTSVTHLYLCLCYICDFFMTSVAHLYRGANEEDRVAHCPCLGRSQSCKTTLGKPATAALEKYRTGEKRNTELGNSEILLRRRLAVNSVN